jgi:hypothetical protein
MIAMTSGVGAIFRATAKAAGLLFTLILLPGPAQADCHHASGHADYGDYGGYVPVSHHAKHDTGKPQDRKPATPAKPPPCQGCFNCGQTPTSAPTSTFSGFELHDLLVLMASALDCDPCSRRAEHEPNASRQQPVFTITHPPRVRI